MLNRLDIIASLNKQIKKDISLLGVATGNGMSAKHAEEGGADFILALSSGRYRQMGVSSLAGFLPYGNSNEIVMDFSSKELIPMIKRIPVCFGINATDPTINLVDYIDLIKEKGFSGINNFPSVALFDGQFRDSLEDEGMSYLQEVEAIRIAHRKDLFTVAFVFNKEQAELMIHAGADVICVHLGLTEGGTLGAKKLMPLQSAKKTATDILDKCTQLNPNVIRMIYGGPVNKPIDVQFMSDNTTIMGYIGGSVFERIPAEQMFVSVAKSFKETSDYQYDELIRKFMDGIENQSDYIEFIKKYISLHFMDNITLNEVSDILSLSRSYLSTLFKKEMGISFTQYLIDFRLNRAIEIIQVENLPLGRVAEMVGYSNYPQFSKIFKKHRGISPREVPKERHKHKFE